MKLGRRGRQVLDKQIGRPDLTELTANEGYI